MIVSPPVPETESLKDTIARALPYYEEAIAPALRAGRRVLIAAHGNSLRGIIKHLSGIGDEEIVAFALVVEPGDAVNAGDRRDIRTARPVVLPVDSDRVHRIWVHGYCMNQP